jgi:hypothetical protein
MRAHDGSVGRNPRQRNRVAALHTLDGYGRLHNYVDKSSFHCFFHPTIDEYGGATLPDDSPHGLVFNDALMMPLID